MLVIKEVFTSYEREEYTKMFGFVPEAGFHVIAAHNAGKFVGSAYLTYEGENGVIKHMSLIDGYDDFTDKFLLGKAALNHMDLAGVKNVIYTGKNESLAKSLGFKGDIGNMTLSLVGYFGGGHCEGEKDVK